MTTLKNPRKKAGEQSVRALYNDGKVRRRREWRGFRDTFYDYTRWLYLVFILARFLSKPRNIKGFFRYRWMGNFLGVMHGMDKFTIGLRDEPLRITHIAMSLVIAEVTQVIDDCFRGDRRVGNDEAFSRDSILTDENGMVAFMMGFPGVHAIMREIPTMFAGNIFNQYSATHYIDVAQEFGIPGDVCPMPETELGISIDDDFCVLGCCAVQVNTTCDGSLMGNGLIANRLEKEYGIPTFQLAAPLRHREEDVQNYAAEDMKKAIAFIEEHTGQKWDWSAYFTAAKRVNDATRKRLWQLEINGTDYPQFFGAVFSLYNDTNYMGNCGRNPQFVKTDRKLQMLAEQGVRRKTMAAAEYRHRCVVWGVQPQYIIDMLYWMLQCWGVMPLTDMLSMINTKMLAEEDTPENREQAYYDMAWLNENMIMRNRTHGGHKVLVEELWEICEKMNADMVMMWEHMSCKALVGLHGQFEEQARERGIKLVWVNHDLCDPRIYSRAAIRDQFNLFMRTVMQETPLDPSIETLPDNTAW